jgi:hypothetical protein
MSLGNPSIHQQGDIPEIVKLPNDRIRVIRRFQKFTREDVDNVNLGSLMGDFGAFDDLDEQIPEQGYENCRLISVEVDTRFNATNNADNAVLVKTYETLTNSFVEITDPTVEVEENGLTKITKTYRAVAGTKPSNKLGIQAAYTAKNAQNIIIVDTSGEGSGIYEPSENFNQWTGIDNDKRYVFQNTQAGEGAGQWVWYDVVDSNPLYFSDTTGYLPWEVEWPSAAGISFNLVNNSTVYGILADIQVEDNTAFAELTEIYLERGTISVDKSSGPQGLPSTYTRRYTSRFTEPTSSGIALGRDVSNVNGYPQYVYTFLEGSVEGSSPLGQSGQIISYDEIIEVRQAGVVSASSESVTGGDIAVLSIVPPSIKKVKATVAISLVTTNTLSDPANFAYNLSDTSASAAITTTKTSPVGIEQGSSLTVSVFNNRSSSDTRTFPNHYRSGGGATGQVQSDAQIIRDEDNIIGEALEETTDTSIVLTGSTSAPNTTGTYQENIEPAFLDADGTQYYRKTVYSIS